jgi:hypothetical protein
MASPESPANEERIAFVSRSLTTRDFAIEHSVYVETSPKQQVAGSSPARGTKILGGRSDS